MLRTASQGGNERGSRLQGTTVGIGVMVILSG